MCASGIAGYHGLEISIYAPRSTSPKPNNLPTSTTTMASEAINLVAVIYPKPEKAAEVSELPLTQI